jgi:hypothetical protein
MVFLTEKYKYVSFYLKSTLPKFKLMIKEKCLSDFFKELKQVVKFQFTKNLLHLDITLIQFFYEEKIIGVY